MASGDVVNTAARLQSAAPVNGIVVDETTYRATRHAIDYREGGTRRSEGEGRADRDLGGTRGTRTIRREVLDHVAGDLVGREHEVDALRAALDRVRRERLHNS